MEAEPLLKVRGLRVAVSMLATPALPPAGRAIEAAVMGRSLPPKVLLIWMRRRSAPMERCRVWRRVASLKAPPPPFYVGPVSFTNSGVIMAVTTYKWRGRHVVWLNQLRHGRPGGHPMPVGVLPRSQNIPA